MLTVNIVDERLETLLRERASANGHSPEEEVQAILGAALPPPASDLNLGQALHRAFAELGGVELELDWLRRLPDREPPTFD